MSHLIKMKLEAHQSLNAATGAIEALAFVPALFLCVQKFRHPACFAALKQLMSSMLV